MVEFRYVVEAYPSTLYLVQEQTLSAAYDTLSECNSALRYMGLHHDVEINFEWREKHKGKGWTTMKHVDIVKQMIHELL